MPMLDRTLNTVIMPFRLKLKRTGRYILSYKNSFLIRVQLLDNTAMEFTLTIESTGSDCLNALAQKLDLRETKYFGLHYFNKLNKIRWVELDKPLKKQIDKNANEPNLYFGVVYYVANIDSLEQEITRYLFYLQLKNNVICGILQCTKNEAVELASYILQAEFGNHDPGVHNVEYFRDYILFPEALTPDEEGLDRLTMEAIEFQKRHRGLRPADSECNFILKAIHLVGFSEELQSAKNTFGYDVMVGCSFAGIVIKSQPMKSHPLNANKLKSVSHDWSSVEHLSHNKQTLSIEIRRDDASISFFQFIMDDADTAKYLCRVCENQRKFYLQNKETTVKLPPEAASTLIRRPTLRRNPEVDNEELGQSVVALQTGSEFPAAQDSKQLYNADHYFSSQTSLDHPYVSQTSLNRQPQHDQAAFSRYSNGFGGSMYSSPSINSLVQSHVGRPSPATSNLSINSSHQRAVNRTGLPHYRPSPDYEVALRQRRRYSSYLEGNNPGVVHHSASQQQPSTNVPQPSLKPRPHSMIYSQQELVNQATHGPPLAHHYPQQHQPPHFRRSQPPLDSSQGLMGNRMHWDTSHESLSPQGGSQVVDPRLVSLEGRDLRAMAGSTPELTFQQQQGRPLFVSEIQLYRHYQTPPNTYQGSASTSTPDLTQHKQNVSSSSPDLHLGQNQPQRPHRPLPPVQSYTEEAYNNDQRMMMQLMSNQLTPSPEKVMTRKEHIPSVSDAVLLRPDPAQHRPASSSMDILDSRSVSRQTPQQNVQAYLEQVGHSQQSAAAEFNKPYARPLAGSREHLLQQDQYDPRSYNNQQRAPPIRGTSGSQVVMRQPYNDNHPNYPQPAKKKQYHHAPAPSTGTVVVHSDNEGEVTSDYMLSQQLQDRGLEQVRISRSQEFLDSEHSLSTADVINHVTDSTQNLNLGNRMNTSGPQPTSSFRPPPPYPINYSNNHPPHSNASEEPPVSQVQVPPESPPSNVRGPPPPYHTPSPSVLGEVDKTSIEEGGSGEHRSGSFRQTRRSASHNMAPLKFAAMNGLNASQRANSPVKGEPDERVLSLEATLDGGHLLSEYDNVPRTRPSDFEFESFPSRDRIKEVVSYPDNCVSITPSSDNPTGYINASHIKATIGDECWHYIACQTPLEGYEHEMWDLVWTNDVSVIVLNTKEEEHGKVRCARYWPMSLDLNDIPTAVFGQYKIMSKFDSSTSRSGEHLSRVTRNLVLERAGSSEKRIVWLLQYVNWPETGVPKETDDYLGFLEELQSIRRLAGDASERRNPDPVLVQCSSGSGRSGVLVLTELMIQCLEQNQNISVADMLHHLRHYRMHFVQTFSQYNFVYKVLISFLRKSRLI